MTISRSRLEAACREVAAAIKPLVARLFGKRVGSTVFLFTFEPGVIAYLSTANREDMIRSIEKWLAAQKAGLTTDPAGPRGTA